MSTGDYTDYDVVINTTEETFRLPLLDGSEDLPGSRSIDLKNEMTKDTTIAFTAPGNGQYTFGVYSTAVGQMMNIHNVTSDRGISIQSGKSSGLIKANLEAKRGDLVHLTYNVGGNINNGVFKYHVGNGSLYYYVGETVQNANLINVGKIEEEIASLIPNNCDLISGYGMPSSNVVNLTLGATGTQYTAPANGYAMLRTYSTSSNAIAQIYNMSTQYSDCRATSTSSKQLTPIVPLKKGQTFKVYYGDVNTTDEWFRFCFIYAEGSN